MLILAMVWGYAFSHHAQRARGFNAATRYALAVLHCIATTHACTVAHLEPKTSPSSFPLIKGRLRNEKVMTTGHETSVITSYGHHHVNRHQCPTNTGALFHTRSPSSLQHRALPHLCGSNRCPHVEQGSVFHVSSIAPHSTNGRDSLPQHQHHVISISAPSLLHHQVHLV